MATFDAPMVGRDRELEVLLRALADGHDGRRGVVVVRGEAGIGKTRLLDEFLAAAGSGSEQLPITVVRGQCVDVGEIGTPFTPIRRLLRELYQAVGDNRFRAAAGTPAVLANLGALMPELGATADAPNAAGADLVADALERIIEDLSADHHLLMVIEDLHWADAATIALLRTLSVTLRGSHVTVALSLRTDDVGRGHPLRPLLAEWDRNRAVTTVTVPRLDPVDTKALAQRIGPALGPAELAAVVGRSDGVPFYLEELVDATHGPLPDTLRELVLVRYERLSDAARDAVAVLAVGGLSVPDDLLVAVSPMDPGDLRRGLRDALDAQLLVAADDGYLFRHALIQETVAADLLPSERAQLNRRYAEVLQQRVVAEPDVAAQLAEHWLRSKDIPRGFDATVLAYHHAEASLAPVAMARLGERLLELWPQVPDAGARAGRSFAEMAVALADQWNDLGEWDRALRVARVGAANSAPQDDPAVRADLHRVTGSLLLTLDQGDRGRAEFGAGIALVADRSEVPAIVAHVRLLGLTATMADPSDVSAQDRMAAATRALELAGQIQSPIATVAALKAGAWTCCDRGELEEALVLSDRMAQVPDVDGGTRLNGVLSRIDLLVRLGRFAEAITEGYSSMALAESLGHDHGMGAMIAANVGEALFAIGDLERAVPLLERTVPMSGIFGSFGARVLAQVRSWGGLTADSDPPDPGAGAVADDIEEQVGWAEVRAEVALNQFEGRSERGDRDLLVRAAVAASEGIHPDVLRDYSGMSRRMLPGAARALAEAHRSGLDVGSIERLDARVDAMRTALRGDRPADGYRALVAAELAPADGHDPTAWRAAVEALADGFLPMRYAHYARYRLVGALIAQGDRDDAAAMAAELLTAAPETPIVTRWTRELAVRARLPGPALETLVRTGSPSTTGPLTAREQQVLALVAEGLTNPQIGARLYISPKTASVHVSAILAKIGAANRAEAAALYSAAHH